MTAHLPYRVDFDELNALATVVDDDYPPPPEDILHTSLVSASATSFRQLAHEPASSSNGYEYRVPANPMRLPERTGDGGSGRRQK